MVISRINDPFVHNKKVKHFHTDSEKKNAFPNPNKEHVK